MDQHQPTYLDSDMLLVPVYDSAYDLSDDSPSMLVEDDNTLNSMIFESSQPARSRIELPFPSGFSVKTNEEFLTNTNWSPAANHLISASNSQKFSLQETNQLPEGRASIPQLEEQHMIPQSLENDSSSQLSFNDLRGYQEVRREFNLKMKSSYEQQISQRRRDLPGFFEIQLAKESLESTFQMQQREIDQLVSACGSID